MNDLIDFIDSPLAYLLPAEKYIPRNGKVWMLEGAFALDRTAINHLTNLGIPSNEAKRIINQREYPALHGTITAPGKPPVYREGSLNYLNLWVAPTLTSQPGPWPTIKAILDHLTGGDQIGATWLLHWLAAKIQNPAFLPKVAVIFTTEQGAGKGTLTRVIQEMIGAENTATIGRYELESRFNSLWARKLFVFGDEVINGDRLKTIDEKLKVLIDGNQIQLEGKFKNQQTVENRIAWIFSSNSKIGPLDLQEGDRRYTVFSNHTPVTPEYRAKLVSMFDPLDRKAWTPGALAEISGLYYDLLHWSVDYALISRPYDNPARRDLISAARPSHEDFLHYVDENGLDELLEKLILRTSDWTMKMSRLEWDFGTEGVSFQALYQVYVFYCEQTGCKALKQQRLGMAIRNHTPGWAPVRKYVKSINKQVSGYVVPRIPHSNGEVRQTLEVSA